ncbi:MAG: ECF RNA polymerase sigma factor SigE [Verrucomicrobiae bacterium]|nr:ECF RNA polymerase sigma factor SigE [Verrucomicrobiae bacterium]
MERAEKISVNISAAAASNPVHEDAPLEPSDLELVERCQRGELEAFEALVGRHRQRVYQYAYSRVRNEQDATDLSQETFVKAWRAIRGFKKTAQFSTWLYRITTNLVIDQARRRERRPEVPFEEAVDPDADANVEIPPSSQPSPTDEAQRKELREQIDAALAELSPDHRAVLQLREFDGFDYAEIAKAVGCSLGTVMSRLHYARKHMQKLLKDVI